MLEGGRIWLVLGGLVGVIVIVLGWFVGASPLFDQAARADAQRVEVETLNAAQEALLAEMKALDEDEILARYAELEESVPLTLDLEGYFDWVATAAAKSGVSLVYASVTEAVPYAKAEDSLGTLSLGGELEAALGVVSVEISISGDGESMNKFTQLLQTDGRLQLIDGVNIKLGTSLTGILTGYIFVIDDPALAAIAAAAQETPDEGTGTEGETDGEEAEETPAPEEPSSTPTPAARG